VSARSRATGGARVVAQRVLVRWQGSRRHAVDLLDEAARQVELSGSDRALALDLTLTVLRNLSLLDHWIGVLTGGGRLDEKTRLLLRQGLAEVMLLRTAPHAAVNETVSLGGRARGLVNAVLRRALRERETLLGDAAPLPEAVRLSHPEWLLERWRDQLGSDAALALAVWNQQPAPVYVRANGLREGSLERLRELPGLEEREDGLFRCSITPVDALRAGDCYAQDPGTLAASRLTAARPGERVLDACAAPGGKTAVLAESMEGGAGLTACDVEGWRLRRLRENLTRLGADSVEVRAVNWLEASPETIRDLGLFDAVLLDAPCSNTGVMRRRVDARWRLRQEDFAVHQSVQLALLRRCGEVVKPGGRLIYSTCSVDRAENGDVVELFLAENPGWTMEETTSLIPPGCGTDGAYCARLRRPD
jgi:16S rRNA (cytosine967-C5)-methyltransferase